MPTEDYERRTDGKEESREKGGERNDIERSSESFETRLK
jgi:hypothetical protein